MKSYFKNGGSRGQAALEFMMTYGWAILVVLSAIGALSYFGVLNPSRFTPDTCLASAPFSCPGKPIAMAPSGALTANITFSLVNGQGFPVSLPATISGVALNLTGSLSSCNQARVCAIGDTSCLNGTAYTVAAGQGATVRLYNCAGITTTTNIVKGDAIFYYTNPQSQLTEQILISVTAKPR